MSNGKHSRYLSGDSKIAVSVAFAGLICQWVNMVFATIWSGAGNFQHSSIVGGGSLDVWQRFLLVNARIMVPTVIVLGGVVLLLICPASSRGGSDCRQVRPSTPNASKHSGHSIGRWIGQLLVWLAVIYHLAIMLLGGPCTSRAQLCWSANQMIETSPFAVQAGIPLLVSVAGMVVLGVMFRHPRYRYSSDRASASQ